jgi:hypothetical protein
MVLVRRVGYALIALAAIGVWLFMAPQPGETVAQDKRVSQINDEDDANNAMTEGAPQQEVVNGWTSVAYLELISDQLNTTPEPDRRPAALLTLLVLAACLHCGTASPATGMLVQRVPVPRPTGPGTVPGATGSSGSAAPQGATAASPGATPPVAAPGTPA